MKTLISRNLPPLLLLPNQPLPLKLGVSSFRLPSNCSSSSSTRLCAESETRGRGFSGGRKTEQEVVGPTKPAGGEEEELSPVVINRMIVRILAYVGAPMAVGLGTLQIYAVLKENQIWDPPLWLTFLTLFVAFGGSVLGVPYGALSTNWDPDKEGSLLGFEEASHNWVQMWSQDAD